MSIVTKEQLLAAVPQSTTVEIKALGGEVKIRSLSRGARKAWMEAVQAGDLDAMEILIAESLVEPTLSRKDVSGLNAVDERVVDELFVAIRDWNGWGEAGDESGRRELLNQLAEGEVGVDEALARFRAGA